MITPRSKMTLRGCTFGKLLFLHLKAFDSSPVFWHGIGAPTVECLPDYNTKLRRAYDATRKSA